MKNNKISYYFKDGKLLIPLVDNYQTSTLLDRWLSIEDLIIKLGKYAYNLHDMGAVTLDRNIEMERLQKKRWEIYHSFHNLLFHTHYSSPERQKSLLTKIKQLINEHTENEK